MKSQFALAVLFAATPLATVAIHAQQTGVSNPPDAIVEDKPVPAPAPVAKPSAAIPVAQATPAVAPQPIADEEFKPYTPLHSNVVLRARDTAAANPDSGIVLDVPRRPGELPTGTTMRVRLNSVIETSMTQPNSPFTATLEQPVESDGRTILPAGSILEGTVTDVRGGRRIHGTAMIHLQTQAIVLPDGTRIPLRAAVVDTDQYAETRIDSEGNILRKDHFGATVATMSLATAGGAAAGAILGGPAGALVGAGVGAGVSTAVWLKQDRQTHLPKDTLVVLSLTEPMAFAANARRSDFSANPMTQTTTMTSATSQASLPAPAPAYVAPQAFVPTN